MERDGEAMKKEIVRLEDDVWGEGYKIVVGRLKGKQFSYAQEESKPEEIVTALFLVVPRVEWVRVAGGLGVERFSEEVAVSVGK